VKGTIADAGKFLRGLALPNTFDMSTLREPYRIEGKKTMAYELVEQLGGGSARRRVFIPPAAARALIGMWKGVRRDGRGSGG